eukprot:scaffold76522_cov63-Phaeocystis_antarctica.AAC.5
MIGAIGLNQHVLAVDAQDQIDRETLGGTVLLAHAAQPGALQGVVHFVLQLTRKGARRRASPVAPEPSCAMHAGDGYRCAARTEPELCQMQLVGRCVGRVVPPLDLGVRLPSFVPGDGRFQVCVTGGATLACVAGGATIDCRRMQSPCLTC